MKRGIYCCYLESIPSPENEEEEEEEEILSAEQPPLIFFFVYDGASWHHCQQQ